MKNWRISSASIPGSDHTMPGKPGWKNNQDATFAYNDDSLTIGIVADGCGSGKHSEVGAEIGVRLFGEMLRQSATRSLELGNMSFAGFERLRMNLLGQISVLACQMGQSLSTVVNDYFLFSLVGFIATQEETIFFYCGDGVYFVNGESVKLGPFPGNKPPYILYGLMGDSSPSFEIVSYKTSSVTSVAVGTDGTDYILDLDSVLLKWSSMDLVFKNPDFLRRQLALMNLERVENGILTPGPLKDDISIVLAGNF